MRRGRCLVCVALAGVMTLAGCADSEPFEYTPIGEIRPGPGLFSGKKGAFYLYGKKTKAVGDDETPPRAEP